MNWYLSWILCVYLRNKMNHWTHFSSLNEGSLKDNNEQTGLGWVEVGKCCISPSHELFHVNPITLAHLEVKFKHHVLGILHHFPWQVFKKHFVGTVIGCLPYIYSQPKCYLWHSTWFPSVNRSDSWVQSQKQALHIIGCDQNTKQKEMFFFLLKIIV